MSEKIEDLIAQLDGSEVAIIGMAGRFPGAQDVETFWNNLRDGVESISFFSDEELIEAGVSPDKVRHPNYVKARGVMEDMEKFDAGFFGFSPRDGAIMDPQHRHFLECSWEALEYAGYDPNRFDGLIGVYGGSGYNGYMPHCLLTNPDLVSSIGFFLLRHTGNDKDFLTTRVSYLMDLKGPSVNVQSACSTSLVATHLASQSLINGECDMALAGGVTIEVPHRRGYTYHEGEILSPDGHCRAFDADAKGTIFGSGVGVVVLRRLEDALEAGDTIHAVIKGSAINNDGAGKVNYLAPSVDGQSAAIAEAIAMADVDVDSITYVETHGTGTRIGDPIEITALTEAFRTATENKGFCGVGSVKTNIGHLDTAAGVAGLIKTVMALKHKQLPPSLNFSRPNPLIDFENSAFYVNDELQAWQNGQGPRRAGVNSLGVGGTNAFVILEEAPTLPPTDVSDRPWHLITLSARNNDALDAATQNFANYLRENPDANLADITYTLQVGRKPFAQRRSFVCRDIDDAIAVIENKDRKRIGNGRANDSEPSVVFMFPGGGAQYPNMGLDIYENEPEFRTHIDQCLELVKSYLEADLRALMFPAEDQLEDARKQLQRPSLALPALFMTEYALAKLWMSWGIQPVAMTGHSMGEYTAACLAGVLSVEDALSIVTLRGQLFETLPEGGMLSVSMPEDELQPLLIEGLSIAVINGPEMCVVSGEVQAIEKLEKSLTEKEVECRRVKIDVAAHSPMLDPILEEFGQRLSKIQFNPPQQPYVSNVTGDWVKPEDAVDPQYWVRHLRQTVRFADGMKVLFEDNPNRILVEIGPGQTLSSLSRMHPDKQKTHTIQPAFPHPKEDISDLQHVFGAVGKVWQAGLSIDWTLFYKNEYRRRIPLPTYPFEKQHCWIEPGAQLLGSTSAVKPVLAKKPDLDDWFYRPVWKKTDRPTPQQADTESESNVWLVFKDRLGLGDSVEKQLKRAGHTVITVSLGDQFAQLNKNAYVINAKLQADYEVLAEELKDRELRPDHVVHLWSVDNNGKGRSRINVNRKQQNKGFFSLLYLTQALSSEEMLDEPMNMTVVSNGMQRVKGESLPAPEKATLLGPCRVIPKEYPGVSCQSIDIEFTPVKKLKFLSLNSSQHDDLAQRLVDEIKAKSEDHTVAFRGSDRWVQEYEASPVEAGLPEKSRLKPEGVYLITGGMGGIGLTMAEHLASTVKAKLVLLSRSGLPNRDQWDDWLRNQPMSSKTSQKIQKIQALEALGAEVLVVKADVTNVIEMTDVVQQVKDRFGTINGVIHAAGTLLDGLIQLKKPDEATNVMAPKVLGTIILNELLKDFTLDFFVLFSSTSSFLGSIGQVDYTGANAFLNAFAESYSEKTGRYAVAIDWGMWQEVGMAADAAVEMGIIEQKRQAGRVMPHPLLDECILDTNEETIYATEYSVDEFWLLDQHRIKGGEALIPGTGYLEIAKAALEKGSPNGAVQIEHLFFLSPLEVKEGEKKEVRTTIKKKEGEAYSFSVTTRQNDSEWLEHASGTVKHVKTVPSPESYSIDEIAARCNVREISFEGKRQETKQEAHLDFGPRWKNLKSLQIGNLEALASLELSDRFAGDIEEFALHPALMDIATGYALTLIDDYEDNDDFYVPMSYKRVKVYGPLPKKIYSYARSSKETTIQKDVPAIDFKIMDEQGNVVVEIDEFVMKRVDRESMINKTNRPDAGQQGQASSNGMSYDSEPTLLQLGMTEGIVPPEGIEAFNRILSNDTSTQVVVSSLDLDLLIDKVSSEGSAEEDNGGGFQAERPNLQSEYVAPRTKIEKTLVKLWEDLLGVNDIGIHDDFFELGGHSLIAVRLFARVKKVYSVDFSLATLFEYPTVADFTELLKDELGISDGVEENSETKQLIRTKRKRTREWSPLVSIQPKGSARPFFCVHGIFGNVLRFYELSRYLGSDQPFYGLQAQGTDGKKPGLNSIEDMASLYIDAMKTVQPEGPYLLGGYSLGGEIAFEMAHQLIANKEKVGLLVLLDTFEPGYARLKSSREKIDESIREGDEHLIVRRKGNLLFTWLKKKVRSFSTQQLLPLLGHAYLLAGKTMPLILTKYVLDKSHTAAMFRYIPKPFPGRLTLFRASATLKYGLGDPSISWEALAMDGVDLHIIDGTHRIVNEPYVRLLAQELKMRIEKTHVSSHEGLEDSALENASLV